MIDANLKKPQVSEGKVFVTTKGAQRSERPWNGLDGVDERDDPYANLRYPFKADLLKGGDRALAGSVASDEMAGRSKQKPRGFSSAATRVLPAQDTQVGHVKQERSISQEQNAGWEGQRPTSTRNRSKETRVPEELAAKHHLPPAPQSNKNETQALKNAALAERHNQQSARTASPTLRLALSGSPSPALLQSMPPPPRHSPSQPSQRFNHRADPTPDSVQTETFAQRAFGPKEQSTPRAYAPGLAMRKRKVDLYDQTGLTAPRQPFSMARSKPGPDARGSWTSFDTDKNILNFDKRWHAEQNRDRAASGGGGNTGPTAAAQDCGFDESSDEKLDDRFENPELDVDEDVRKEFRSVKDLMTEQPPPGSLRDHRNPFLLQSATSAPLMVVIGGRVAKVLKPEADRRGESQDRFGNYIGKNLGLMKKHLIEDRQMKIKRRDEEMVEATRQKRAFKASDPKQRELVLEKGQRPSGPITGGQGAASADVFEFSDIPEIYLRSMAEGILGRGTRTTPLPNQSTEWSSHQTSVAPSGEYLDMPTSIGGQPHQSMHTPSAPNSVARATGANATEIGRTTKLRDRKTGAVPSTGPSTPSFVSEDPKLAPIEDIEDIPGEIVVEDDETKAEVWTGLYRLSSIRGRVVSVVLHDPVQFTPGAVMERVFGGIIQEVQFHPKERIALIAFLFPAEAEDFVKHVKATKKNNNQEYRRLQIDADWYQGSEHSAVYPFRHQITLRAIGENAGRVLGINGVSQHKKKEDVNRELNIYLGKLMVRVGLITPNKRYVLERGKNQGFFSKQTPLPPPRQS
ncbi:MAG: hypothetical protein M1840_002608 [Geoglossum simile]|nr:MAG: hypothetical protein M1840_002608 [Geoglossum simile]